MIEVGVRIERWEGKAILKLAESSDGFILEVCLKAALPRAWGGAAQVSAGDWVRQASTPRISPHGLVC
jgi:hypothetical protein